MEINKCMGCMEEFRGYPCPDCGYVPEKQLDALPMETILNGKYLVGRALGMERTGFTYIGWDIALERKVAIKEYYPFAQVSRAPGTRTLTWHTIGNDRQDGMRIFLEPAWKMARVGRIPGVVRILDLFQENDTVYIVMDFVEGQTLQSLLHRNGPMSWEQAQAIFRPAIHAMERVHAAGLVHRDFSPDKLMISPNGSVTILYPSDDRLSNTIYDDACIMFNGFRPVEQYTKRGELGPWTDVYAMAATIYRTLTGKLPPMSIDRIQEDTIRWDYPGLLALPVQTLEALKKAMTVRPKMRTQTMAELEKACFPKSGSQNTHPERDWVGARSALPWLRDFITQ